MVSHFAFKQELAKGSSDCAKNAIYDKSGITGCQNVGGQAAKKGRRGKDGGYAGKSGIVETYDW